jgi:hypothetical protein
METKMNILKSKYQPKNSRDNLWFDGSRFSFEYNGMRLSLNAIPDINSDEVPEEALINYLKEGNTLRYCSSEDGIIFSIDAAYSFNTNSLCENFYYIEPISAYSVALCIQSTKNADEDTALSTATTFMRFCIPVDKLESDYIEAYNQGADLYLNSVNYRSKITVDPDKKYASHIRVEEGSNGEPVLAVYYAKFEDGAEFKKAEISLGGAS